MQTTQSEVTFPKLDGSAVRLELEKAKAARLMLLEQQWRAAGKSERNVQRLRESFLRVFKYGKRDRYTHTSWRAMMARCYCPTHDQFKWYGALGITVCERWHDFVNFLIDIDPPPRPEEGEDDDEDRRYWAWLDRITKEP